MAGHSRLDFYAVLQVHPKASPEVIKKAYHTLMQKNHPDRGGDERIAKQLNEAYDVLIDDKKRQAYDRRALVQKSQLARERKKRQEKKAQMAEAIRNAGPKELTRLKGKRLSPMLWGEHFLLADERGQKVLLMNVKGERVWSYGKTRETYLKKPRLAHFDPQGAIWILDAGEQRLRKVNLEKKTLWEFNYEGLGTAAHAAAQPQFIDFHEDKILLVDKGNRALFELNQKGEVIWEFRGQVGFQLNLLHLQIKAEQFVPLCAQYLDSGNLLITDQGNGKIFELSKKGKVQWVYPGAKDQKLTGVNFARRLPNGKTWIASDTLLEVNQKGEDLWHFSRLKDSDIKQVYPLENNRLIVDFSHLVKRGINQEVIVLNHQSKILLRHYYSQHRFM